MWLVTLAWQRAITATLRPYELTHVQFVLLAGAWWLGTQDGPPTQSRLAMHAGTDPMMTSQVLRRLAARGLVERLPDPADTRAKRIRLTVAGEDLLQQALPDVDATDAEFFRSVVKSDLLTMLTRLAAGANE